MDRLLELGMKDMDHLERLREEEVGVHREVEAAREAIVRPQQLGLFTVVEVAADPTAVTVEWS